MNTVTSLLLLVIVIAFFYLLAKGLWTRITRRLTWKNNLFLAGIYFLILLLLVPLSTLLPKDDFVGSSNDGTKVSILTQAPSNWSFDPQKYHIPPEGRFDEQSGVYKNSSQTFQAETNQLTLVSAENTGYNLIFLERKDSDDGEIEVSSYVAPHYADSVDFTRMVSPPRISFEKGVLTIKPSHQQNLVFKRLRDSFSVNQFKQMEQNTREGNISIFGWDAVYIRVPKALKVVQDEGFQGQLTWVNSKNQ